MTFWEREGELAVPHFSCNAYVSTLLFQKASENRVTSIETLNSVNLY